MQNNLINAILGYGWFKKYLVSDYEFESKST